MSQARQAGFRRLRGFGWSVAVFIAAGFFLIAWLASGNLSSSLATGAIVSIIGLAILSIGYLLGDIWEGYWMIPTVLVGGNVALIVAAFGGSWLSALLGTMVVVLMSAGVAAINRTAGGEGGVAQLIRYFIDSLIPGRYSS